MNKIYILLFIIIITIIYLLYKVNKVDRKEKFATDSPTMLNIEQEVENYMKNRNNIGITESIKNLGILAKRLMNGSITVLPGDLKVNSLTISNLNKNDPIDYTFSITDDASIKLQRKNNNGTLKLQNMDLRVNHNQNKKGHIISEKGNIVSGQHTISNNVGIFRDSILLDNNHGKIYNNDGSYITIKNGVTVNGNLNTSQDVNIKGNLNTLQDVNIKNNGKLQFYNNKPEKVGVMHVGCVNNGKPHIYIDSTGGAGPTISRHAPGRGGVHINCNSNFESISP